MVYRYRNKSIWIFCDVKFQDGKKFKLVFVINIFTCCVCVFSHCYSKAQSLAISRMSNTPTMKMNQNTLQRNQLITRKGRGNNYTGRCKKKFPDWLHFSTSWHQPITVGFYYIITKKTTFLRYFGCVDILTTETFSFLILNH